MNTVLKLGIPKGSLEKATIELFRKSGWRIATDARSYFPSIDDEELSCRLIRAQEMSWHVEGGIIDLGITGVDWIRENGSNVVVVQDLVYSKSTLRPARWVLVVRDDSPVTRIEDLEGRKISTELVNFTRRYFAERSIDVNVEFSWGATEAKVVDGLVDAIVEVTETGSTIKAHNLKIICELMSTNPQLIASKEAWEDPWKRNKIEQIALLLKGALQAEAMVGLKMNVPQAKLSHLITILPSLTSPTVASLYNSDWYSVETVIAESMARDLIPRLQKAGAEGIIEYPLNKVI
ncbi:MAG TPA: ATP phosphoribosyltransferase [Thermodesulfobacteriota bacterium]|nr:ATP phosphoribosyltransferase [Deltaproteobacteria bacterium]HNR12718.1 ATP phosphoribosyltransferase [Thermodesulfobacteriota bacterium]HNU72053.1 ATP phosphoribosyltransferase [Thermodesulfobacteriota bacterium]HQO77754.1 ATP phosphoribosyltransferase [Thermodesulfobacteriota bacterium]